MKAPAWDETGLASKRIPLDHIRGHELFTRTLATRFISDASGYSILASSR